MTESKRMTTDMTVLDVLSGGGSIRLPNGIQLEGDPKTRYISIGYTGVDGEFVSEGLWSLSESGLADALADAEKIARELAEEDEDWED